MAKSQRRSPAGNRTVVWLTALVLASGCAAQEKKAEQSPKPPEQRYPRQLGSESSKIKRENGKTYVWSGGGPPRSPKAEFFDFTGSPIRPEELQFGLGKDRIRSVDYPVFVKPDDPRLMDRRYISNSRYRPDERAKTADEITVIGYALNGEARAYPTALLDGHELVNDTFGGKPVTVGW